MFEMLEREVTRARRHNRPVSMILFDIDHFKRTNDVYGHLAGDAVLRALAKLVLGRVRREELFARYGGEEFALVLPEAPLESALKLAEILRARVEENVFKIGEIEVRITISVGCAQLGKEDQTAVDLVHRADKRLYEAKGAGRNLVRG